MKFKFYFIYLIVLILFSDLCFLITLLLLFTRDFLLILAPAFSNNFFLITNHLTKNIASVNKNINL